MSHTRTEVGASRWVRRQLQGLLGGSPTTLPQRLEPYDASGQRVADGVDAEHLMKRVGGRQALHFPGMIPAREVDIAPDELAVGLAGTDEVKLYPISMLAPHHIVNDHLDGHPVAVTFCRACMSGVAFDAVLDQKTLSFDVFGVYQGVMTMMDAETRTIWAHLTGEGLVGTLAGFRLSLLPAQMGTWERWMDLHPDALTPEVPFEAAPGPRRSGGAPVVKAAASSARDDRLPMEAMVLGVSVGRNVRAYALDTLDRWGSRVVNDKLGTIPLAILSPPGLWPIAYDRRTSQGLVDLRIEGDRIVDQFGSRWDWEGRAITGPLAGQRLRYVSSTVVQWYAWAAYRPRTEVVSLAPIDPALAQHAG